MQYKIVTASCRYLEDEVNAEIRYGWRLYGFPFCTGNKILISGDSGYPGSYESEIAQAMVKDKDNELEPPELVKLNPRKD